jgi:REP element-mobilizing transposase RayT
MRRAKQIELGFWRGSHLGEASRPGRRPGPNPRVPHEPREGVVKRLPCHVVLEVRLGIPPLRSWRIVREIEASFRKACLRNGFRLVHYSIQDDHAHLIVEADDREHLARGMKSIAARFARAVNRALGRSGPVLADRFHHTVLETPRQVRNALAYVLLNTRRHAAKRLAKLRKLGRRVRPLQKTYVLDAASSARWFEGWCEDIELDRSPPRALGWAPAVGAAKTWLLAVGWRRHGLLDPNEVPGGLRAT